MLSARASTWFGLKTPEGNANLEDHPDEFERLWRGFMTARATLGAVLVALQAGLYGMAAQAPSLISLLICSAYLMATLAERIMAAPRQLGPHFNGAWLRIVGVDLLAFAALQTLQDSSINYTPLFALPVLMASILGSQLMAMASAAGVTLLLFGYAGWLSLQAPWNTSALFSQAALTGAGCFAISFIARQMVTRLASVELKAQRSQLATAVQRQVNELIIKTLGEGVLVVDAQHQVRSANPAAKKLLSPPQGALSLPLDLVKTPVWQDLRQLIDESFTTQLAQQRDISVQHAGQGARLVSARTQLTAQLNSDAQGMCVVFLQDQRELQARIRTEKFASMGRMSAAVAHEIRNPLAAIVQANALLSEDVSDPGQQQLTRLVGQNALRLEKTVHDILHIAQRTNTSQVAQADAIDLSQALPRICRDWQSQVANTSDIAVQVPNSAVWVWFDAEHLRRILINLLDNAQRYARPEPEPIQISLHIDPVDAGAPSVCLLVWSDGEPLDPSVEQHLFEPFFSSESRSSGLGLYICRELCESHGASMAYERNHRTFGQTVKPGNEFSVMFCSKPPNTPAGSKQVVAAS
ncbi:ATP-binding protein [Rhodoferax sp.]|uniref:sensor histidine kinase n=1 Tax=Rhodoferax sp. TaxID=50421 RepID=UPI0019EEDE23|nr:ATP-binding protein [Rhodoferax sp.]MBE0472878.1 PAS domain-containing sensor histidine kinase [Rhodoferax sp.]